MSVGKKVIHQVCQVCKSPTVCGKMILLMEMDPIGNTGGAACE